MDWNWDWAIAGITDEIPRTTGAECINYMTNRRRWTEAVLLSSVFLYVMYTTWKRLEPIKLPPQQEIERPHSATRLFLLITMTLVFGIELGFKLAGHSMLFALNPCHVQTCVQIYLLAAKPSKTTTTLFRIQMSNLNGPFLAFLFPEVEGRTYPLEQATYWVQHALLYIIPIYILRSGAYTIEDMSDFKWVKIGTGFMLFYHFSLLNALSIITSINVDHMLCPAVSDPFQGQYYRLAACVHESLLCPLLNKGTVWLCRPRKCPYGDLNSNGSGNSCNSTKNMPLGSEENSEIYHQIQAKHDYASGPVASADSMMRQRFANYEETGGNSNSTGGGSDGEITAIAAEYTMPTTKID